MFAKLARFQGMGPRHAAHSKPAYCNDNHPVRRLATVALRAPRHVLVCGWRQVPASGRLECFWQVVPVEAEMAEEPGISWMIGRMPRLLGAYSPTSLATAGACSL
jgi:hypothetical protein